MRVKKWIWMGSLLCGLIGALEAQVVELPPYTWGENVIGAPPEEGSQGSQVLHFGLADWPCQESPEGRAFVEQYLSRARAFTSDADLLRFASDSVSLDGVYVELGVTTGKTINFLAALNPSRTIYGFDSFQGNPEDYVRDGKPCRKGKFGLKDPSKLPAVLRNVKLIQGPFEESLPYFVRTHLKGRALALLHVDSDLYSSAKTALQALGPAIRPGTIMLFDELYGFPEYQEGEFKALQEFLDESGYGVEYLAYNAMFEAVVVRITAGSQ